MFLHNLFRLVVGSCLINLFTSSNLKWIGLIFAISRTDLCSGVEFAFLDC